MADVSIALNDKEFLEAMKETERETGKTSAFILRDVMRLWAQDLMKKTIDRQGQSHQNKIIEQHIAKVVAPIDEPAALESWRKAFEERGETEIYRRAANGQTYKIEKGDSSRKIVKDASVIASYHRMKRDKRGRVPGRQKSGNEWYPGMILVPNTMFKKYVSDVKKHTGKTKAGWIAGAQLFKAAIPRMISRNAAFGMANGTAGDELNERNMSGDCYMVNSVPWIRSVDRMMDVTMSTRLKDLKSGKYIARWAKAMKAKGVSA